jgi:hypothetical protein
MNQAESKSAVAVMAILCLAAVAWSSLTEDAAPTSAPSVIGERGLPAAAGTAQADRTSPTEAPERVSVAPETEVVMLESLWPSGQLRSSGRWLSGKRIGVHRHWHENGQPLAVETWDGDKGRHGPAFSYHSNGAIASEGAYDCGYATGLWRTYLEGSQLESQGHFEVIVRNGEIVGQQMVGHWVFWSFDGSIDAAKTGRYEKGCRVSP